MTFSELKRQARASLNQHFLYYVILFLPTFILQIAMSILYAKLENNISYDNAAYTGNWYVAILGWAASLLLTGVMFVLIDHGRHLRTYEQPVSRSFTILNRGDYFIGTIGLGILMFIYTFLWSLLLFIPGIIKMLSYSQACYIYRDHLDQGTKISFNQAITESRQMMAGHKWEYFLLNLSFLGWYIACILVLPTIWVVPYAQQTLANYYVVLSAPAKDDQQDDLMTTAK
ncbi:DUF975 family protein [uncultured Secundilactobacillus sp.]|uniref:DUF975 family protein n=1 Tax=uncultured Secundilactobacillus sp. TaxID=2813935 RepID=UPI002585A6AF|nr:DUF975 family protein [uncultured Secundilactobacillus sp.]